MTKEEHIIYLENLRTALKLSNNFSNETMKSLDMAIKALEQQPCEDCVSRQAAIDMLMGRASNLRGTVGDLGGACSGAAKLIAQLPSAQPDIIQCRNCKFASGDSRICMKFGHSPIGELDFCAWAERRTDG